MKRSPMFGILATAATALLIPCAAAAAEPSQSDDTAQADQTDADDDETDEGIPDPKERTIGSGTPTEALPPPRSDDDPRPPPASPQVPTGGVVRQAGIGGQTAYGRSGALELGGSANFINASDFTQLSLNPSFGWFFMDNFEISAILGLSHLSSQGVDSTFVSGLLEPSIHIPFSDAVFGMLGAGVGLAYVEGPGLGFAFAPRAGVNVLIGRSGILTPQVFLQYATHEAITTPAGALLAVSLSYGAGIGYTVMW